jgi:DNA mismatch repair protein MutL
VNGRYIKSKWIQKGIEDGTKEAMMINQFPFAVLFLQLPRDFVDVNVHPNKMQVRFHDEAQITEHFRQAIIKAMHKREPVSSVSLSEIDDTALEKRIKKEEIKQLKEAPEPFEINRLQTVLPRNSNSSSPKVSHSDSSHSSPNHFLGLNSEDKKKTGNVELMFPFEKDAIQMASEQSLINSDLESNTQVASIHKSLEDVASIHKSIEDVNKILVSKVEIDSTLEKNMKDNPILANKGENMDVFLDKQEIKKHKIIGQAFKTYWIVEYKQELYIVDQHAAHEKVLYEAWLKSIQNLSISSQMLLEPKVYNLSDSEYQVFETFHKEIQELGFDVEAFGETTIIVKSVPYLLNMPLNDLDFIFFFDQLVSGEVSIKKEEQYLGKIASIACKSAIKGNDALSVIEYHHLIDQLLILDDPYHCPHGRPTMIRMSKYELEKKFRRIV